ncbi:UNVERIFIED_CONTAM: hypothetical protein HDU68_008096 [Siphonaria sp. JEL0065]|nr:hypothetical protein HDU68_008096 [Siphonaria sp. JEL0065]
MQVKEAIDKAAADSRPPPPPTLEAYLSFDSRSSEPVESVLPNDPILTRFAESRIDFDNHELISIFENATQRIVSFDTGVFANIPRSHFSISQSLDPRIGVDPVAANETSKADGKYFQECGIDKKRDSRFVSKSSCQHGVSVRKNGKGYSSGVHDFSIVHDSLVGILQSWSEFSRENGIYWWIGHGEMIGWYWNAKLLPWDADLDIQISMQQLMQFIAFNGTIIEGRFLIDVNPGFMIRTPQKENVIDARVIDIKTGYLMDITALSQTKEDDPSVYSLVIQVSAYKTLTKQQAQGATNKLWDQIKGKGGCLFSDKLPSTAKSSNLAALWLRAIFHDAGTFDASTKSGGLDASLSLTAESTLEVNGGIAPSLAHLSLPVNSQITKADAIALGGIVTVATCGGPQVNFTTGRADATVSNIVANLPSDSFASVSTIAAGFQRMGLSKLDMLTLVTGSHSMGGAHAAISPSLTNQTFAPFDATPGVFDNDIFKQVLLGKCIVPLDCSFATDSTLLPYIQKFATDQTAFFAQYATSFQKMLGLTASTLSAPVAVNITVHVNLLNEGTYPTVTPTSRKSPPLAAISHSPASHAPPSPSSRPPVPSSRASTQTAKATSSRR